MVTESVPISLFNTPVYWQQVMCAGPMAHLLHPGRCEFHLVLNFVTELLVVSKWKQLLYKTSAHKQLAFCIKI